ncbi:GNAT family N-acetyltransferase [Streptosporangium sp. CA-115845]|uniref:GNAT family N-acetyltransferase n=1 Tax=Streptosporangium sp. CA-115845 TaxID=3240071 RepID=UPI003D8CEF84
MRKLSAREAGDRAVEIAALTRAAYRGSDPLSGLPMPDGARETPAEVMSDVAGGTTVWLAEDAAGRPLGALRVRTTSQGSWRLSRLAVAPSTRGRGLARTLVTAVDRLAVDRRIPVLRLDAVVERCLPSLYARLGFRAVRHWPSGDKPLTEVTMERRPGTAFASAEPCGMALPPPRSDLLLLWLLTRDALLALIGDHEEVRRGAAAFPGAAVAGLDLWRGTPAGAADMLFRRLAPGRPRGSGGFLVFPAERDAVRSHVMPRGVHPLLHAWCRLPPGAEPPLYRF